MNPLRETPLYSVFPCLQDLLAEQAVFKGKTIVFVNSTSRANKIREFVQAEFPLAVVLILSGYSSSEERKAVADDWQAGKADVLISTMVAAQGVRFDVTPKPYIAFADPPPNLAVGRQCLARVREEILDGNF